MAENDDEPADATVADSPRTRSAGTSPHVQLPARFTVKQQLGEGGMGTVVEAYDRVLSRDVAIKVLAREHRDDPNVGTRFLREARAAAQLRHPGIVQVYDIDPEGGFIVMELVRGESLATKLWREKKLPVDEVRRIASAMAAALAVAHAAGIVHRDVKPANVLLGANGEIKLADFGVAYFGDSELTMPGTRVGTPAYMAPEQLRGKDVDASADVYSIGVTLFEAATGARPNDDDERDPQLPVLAATGDPVLAAVVARAIRQRPAARYANGAALAAALDATEVPSVPPAARALGGSRPRWPWLVGLALGVAGAGVAFAVHRAGQAPDAPRGPHRTIALLPFVDQTKDPLLDFAAAGLPNLLGLELHGVPDTTVIGYYKLLDIAGERASRAAWLAAAKQLGADVVVEGKLARAGATIHLVIEVDAIDGTRLDEIVHDVTVEQVPDTVRHAAPALIKAALGREIATGSAPPTSFVADRELQLGIAALEREHLPEAVQHLREALRNAPDLPLAHYYLAAALSWNVPPGGPAHVEIAAALATGKLDEAQRGFLAGISHIADLDNPGGIEVLRPLAEKFADDRDIHYALFECLFHGGRPAEAMAIYRRLHALAPKFRLALIHVFTYYIAHADEAGMAWALELDEPGSDTYNPMWAARVSISRRDYAAAIQLLSKEIAAAKGEANSLRGELIMAYALAGQVELASSLAAELGEHNLADAVLVMLGLATARGDDAARRTWLATAERGAMTNPEGPGRSLPLLLLVSAQVAAASRPELEELSHRLDASVIPTYERGLNLQIAQIFLAERLDDEARLASLAAAPYPEVAALARAAIARRAGQHATAIEAMRTAIAATGDARFLIDEWWRLAGDLRAAGDHAAVVIACDEVLRPRLMLTWAWGSTVRDCLTWSAEAHDRLGHRDEALAARARLAGLH